MSSKTIRARCKSEPDSQSSNGLCHAIDIETNDWISLAMAIKKKRYKCPFCGDLVFKKAGQIRRHHFAHEKNAKCLGSGSYESNLHWGAKVYLCEKLKNNRDFEIEIPLEVVPESNWTKILRKAGATSYKIPVSRFFETLFVEHKVEGHISSYFADVLSTFNGKPEMAWEICVKNPVPEEKIAFFEEQGIPYIELTPIESGKEDFSFTVRRLGNTKLFASDGFSLKSLQDIFAEELQTSVASDVIEYFLDHYQDLINKKLSGDLELLHQFGIPLDQGSLEIPQPFDVLLDYQKTSGTLTIKQTFLKNVSGKQEYFEDLDGIDLVKGKHNFVITLNNKFMDSPLNLCGEFFRQFSNKFTILAALNEENEILEMKTDCVDRDLKRQTFKVEHYSEFRPTTWINMCMLAYNTAENGKPCYRITPDPNMPTEFHEDFPQAILADPTHACYRFILQLKDICKIRLIVGSGKDDKKYVFGFCIDGLYSENDFNSLIKDSLMQSFKKILFTNSFLNDSETGNNSKKSVKKRGR